MTLTTPTEAGTVVAVANPSSDRQKATARSVSFELPPGKASLAHVGLGDSLLGFVSSGRVVHTDKLLMDLPAPSVAFSLGGKGLDQSDVIVVSPLAEGLLYLPGGSFSPLRRRRNRRRAFSDLRARRAAARTSRRRIRSGCRS